ncbi:hypothetical protein SLS63_006825 [Diaporthe eres]|uniref:FAD/NAD(P)-binding domain-containing protein n=1 Tax=Diaporthe eres TaxID=83184 RepID=A0ABR1P703_DIAER
MQDEMETYDAVIIGAGPSGINCAYRVQTEAPETSFAPYKQVFAEGALIMEHIKDAMAKQHIDKHIQFQQKVVSANWSSKAKKWKLVVASQGQTRHITANFLVFGTGYYDYETPLQTIIPGLDNFKGKTFHPQFWLQQYDYSGQKHAVVGSGATAVTLLPRLAEQAAKVTMVQRSPTYIGAKPDATPLSCVVVWERFYHITTCYLLVLFCRASPQAAKGAILKEVAAALPEDVKVKLHFEPNYMPWDQRLCLAPDGDFFKTIRRKNAHVVTGEIDTATEHGIRMKDGTYVAADAIITATGLNMKLEGGV